MGGGENAVSQSPQPQSKKIAVSNILWALDRQESAVHRRRSSLSLSRMNQAEPGIPASKMRWRREFEWLQNGAGIGGSAVLAAASERIQEQPAAEVEHDTKILRSL